MIRQPLPLRINVIKPFIIMRRILNSILLDDPSAITTEDQCNQNLYTNGKDLELYTSR